MEIPKMPKYILELTDSADEREKNGWCEPIESDNPIPIPGIGDRVNIQSPAMMLVVERRLFTYGDEFCQVQVFCRRQP